MLASALRCKSLNDQYEAKTSLDFSPVSRWPSELARKWFVSFAESLRESPDVLAIVAIGSAARGVAHERSDVDFFVVFQNGHPRTKNVPIDVDILWQDAATLEQDLRAGKELAIWAVRYGISIWERQSFWQQLVSTWGGKLAVPSSLPSFQRSAAAARLAEQLLAAHDEEAALEQACLALSHKARALLYRAGVFPASRPELPAQLFQMGEVRLSQFLRAALYGQIRAEELLPLLREYS